MLFLFFEGLAFTGTADKPLGQIPIGNPALICFTEALLPIEAMKSIAKLAASPMTTFLSPQSDGFAIRYFSPNGTEVDLCGHATMVSTFFVKNYVQDGREFAFRLNPNFHSSHFGLTGESSRDGIGISTRAYTSKPVQPSMITDQVAERLGFEPEDIERIYETELKDYVFIVRSNDILRRAKPDFDAVIDIGRENFPHRTLVLSAPSNDGDFDYEARVFVPLLGINEDIACGSVNCSLGPIWANLLIKPCVKMFYCTPNDLGEPVVGGVQNILIEGEQLTIQSNVIPGWGQTFISQKAEDILKDKAFLSLMQKTSKAPDIKDAAHSIVQMKVS